MISRCTSPTTQVFELCPPGKELSQDFSCVLVVLPGHSRPDSAVKPEVGSSCSFAALYVTQSRHVTASRPLRYHIGPTGLVCTARAPARAIEHGCDCRVVGDDDVGSSITASDA